MLFLLDAQLAPALGSKLFARRHSAIHVTERLPGNARDVDIARLANDVSAVLMSKDADFIALSRRGVLRVPFVWIRSGNTDTDRLWAVIDAALPGIVAAVSAGEFVIEVR